MSDQGRKRPGFRLAWMCFSVFSAVVSGLALGGDNTVAAPARDLSTIARVPADLVPTPVSPATAPARGVTAVNPVLSRLRVNAPPLSQRQVFTVVDGAAKRVDDQVANQLGSQLALTAEVLPNAAIRRVPVPADIAARFKGNDDVFILPTRYTATTLNETRAVSFNVFLRVVTNLSYDGEKRGYFARIAAFLRNPEDPMDTSELGQEVPVSIAAEGVGNLMPLKFRQLNAHQEVRLDVASPSDPYLVRAVTALDQGAEPISLGIQRPEIHVSAVKNPIRGFGLEATEINISVEKGGPIDGDVITLEASRGALDPGSVTLRSGVGTATLRSTGLASSIVTASHPGFASGSQTVDFAFPVAFALATIIGGLVGAFLRKRNFRGWPKTAVIGVAAAFILVTAQVVGVQAFGFTVPSGSTGEALFFVLAAVAGYLGKDALNVLAKPGGAAN